MPTPRQLMRTLRGSCTVLSDDTANSITCSTVMSKPDYCNSLLYGMPKTTTDKQQHAQNVLAHVVTQSGSDLTNISADTGFQPRSVSTMR